MKVICNDGKSRYFRVMSEKAECLSCNRIFDIGPHLLGEGLKSHVCKREMDFSTLELAKKFENLFREHRDKYC